MGDKQIILLVGARGVGKKTFIQGFNKYFGKVQPYYFLDPIKDIARTYFNYQDEDTELANKFIDIFAEATDIYCRFLFREMVYAYKNFKENDNKYLIIDMTGASDLTVAQAQIFLDTHHTVLITVLRLFSWNTKQISVW
jgi:predicted AAA+ superfamily ATPase